MTVNSSLIITILSNSGTDWSVSHFETDCLDTPSFSPNASWCSRLSENKVDMPAQAPRIVYGELRRINTLYEYYHCSHIIISLSSPSYLITVIPGVKQICLLYAIANDIRNFVLFGFAEVAEDGTEVWGSLATVMTPAAAFGFLAFNLLCAPCFAAMGAIRRIRSASETRVRS